MSIRHTGFIFIVNLLIALSAIEPAVAGVEITPLRHHRFGGGFEDANTGTSIHLDESAGYALVLDFDIQPDRQVEVYLSRQNTTMSSGGPFTGNPLFDVAVDYYHIGGLYLFDGEPGHPARRPRHLHGDQLRRLDLLCWWLRSPGAQQRLFSG